MLGVEACVIMPNFICFLINKALWLSASYDNCWCYRRLWVTGPQVEAWSKWASGTQVHLSRVALLLDRVQSSREMCYLPALFHDTMTSLERAAWSVISGSHNTLPNLAVKPHCTVLSWKNQEWALALVFSLRWLLHFWVTQKLRGNTMPWSRPLVSDRVFWGRQTPNTFVWRCVSMCVCVSVCVRFFFR